MNNKLIVGASQTGPVMTEDPEAMLPAATKMIEEAAKRNVQFVTFSELFMTPFFPNTLRQDFDHFFVVADGPLMKKLCGLSKQHGIATIWPFGERTAAGGYFNCALACDERGEVLGIYRKTHIPAYFPDEKQGGTGSYERMYFAPGPGLPVFEWHGIRFGHPDLLRPAVPGTVARARIAGRGNHLHADLLLDLQRSGHRAGIGTCRCARAPTRTAFTSLPPTASGRRASAATWAAA